MDKFGIVVIVSGVLFLIYSISCKNKINYYNKYYDNFTFVIVNKEKFLKLQFYISIFNSVCMIIFGIIVIICDLHYIYVTSYPILFHSINYMIKPIGKSKKYLKSKNYLE
ncbi:hypothetical protein GCM10008905_31230 [Clostridium malenominatum]|uniref:Uncharacterized protein n=1 Tax=Clostridium malenominatum TaxID=1539 RepID=A0ABN1J752_9CLOT